MAARAGTAADRIVFLGHATVLIECDGTRLLTDPLLRARVVHLRRHAEPVDRTLLADVDAVLISHLHHDHLDLASLRLLGADVPLIVPSGAAAWLRQRGFHAAVELPVGESTRVGAVTVSAVDARHDGRRAGGPRARAIGFLVRGARAFYFAGDTELFAGMSNLCKGLDVALLPIAGWGPRLGPGHMDPRQAARAAALLRPRIAVPIHWGTFLAIGLGHRHRALLRDPPHRFAAELATLAPDVEVRVLQPGDATVI